MSMKNACAVMALVVAAGVASVASATLTTTTLALTGTSGSAGPGMGPGMTFGVIGTQAVSINNSGDIAFRANLNSAANPQGLWVRVGGAFSNPAIAGGAMPGGGTYTSGTSSVINSPMISDNAQWAFRMGASSGLFGTTGGVASRMLLSGDTAPGTGGATYASSAAGMPLMNSGGSVAFVGNLTTGTGTPAVTVSGANANSTGIWTGPATNPTLALRRDDAVVGDASVRVGAMTTGSLNLNNNGHYAIISSLQGTVSTGNTVGNDQGIITNRSGTSQMIVRRGDSAPNASGAASGEYYRSLGTSLTLNNAGHVAFVGSTRDAAGVQTSSFAMFSDAGSGMMREIGRNGGALPTISNEIAGEFAGVTWASFSRPTLNAADTLYFQASLTGAAPNTNNAIFSMSPTGDFSRIVRGGDVAIVNGDPIGGDAFFNTFSDMTVNANGQIAFRSLLRNSPGIFGGAGGNNQAIFAYDPSGGVCLVARTSDFFEVAPGDFRIISTIGSLGSSGGQDGLSRTLNDNGLLVFTLEFTDGSSGIFSVTIPAPAGGLALMGGMLVASRRRRA